MDYSYRELVWHWIILKFFTVYIPTYILALSKFIFVFTDIPTVSLAQNTSKGFIANVTVQGNARQEPIYFEGGRDSAFIATDPKVFNSSKPFYAFLYGGSQASANITTENKTYGYSRLPSEYFSLDKKWTWLSETYSNLMLFRSVRSEFALVGNWRVETNPRWLLRWIYSLLDAWVADEKVWTGSGNYCQHLWNFHILRRSKMFFYIDVVQCVFFVLEYLLMSALIILNFPIHVSW